MRVILIINDIFEIYAGRLSKIFEKFLIKNISDAADFLHSGFRFRMVVNEIRGYGDGQFTSEFLSLETCDECKKLISQ